MGLSIRLQKPTDGEMLHVLRAFLSPEMLRVLRMHKMQRVVTRDGIRLFSNYYTCENLAHYVGRKVVVYVDVCDLRDVIVCDERDGSIFVARLDSISSLMCDEGTLREVRRRKRLIAEKARALAIDRGRHTFIDRMEVIHE